MSKKYLTLTINKLMADCYRFCGTNPETIKKKFTAGDELRDRRFNYDIDIRISEYRIGLTIAISDIGDNLLLTINSYLHDKQVPVDEVDESDSLDTASHARITTDVYFSGYSFETRNLIVALSRLEPNDFIGYAGNRMRTQVDIMEALSKEIGVDIVENKKDGRWGRSDVETDDILIDKNVFIEFEDDRDDVIGYTCWVGNVHSFNINRYNETDLSIQYDRYELPEMTSIIFMNSWSERIIANPDNAFLILKQACLDYLASK